MNAGKYVFAQIADHLPSRIFDKCVARYSGNKYLRHFKCWNQLLSMMFGPALAVGASGAHQGMRMDKWTYPSASVGRGDCIAMQSFDPLLRDRVSWPMDPV